MSENEHQMFQDHQQHTAVSTAADFGVGARVTLAVMADDFAEVITRALRETDSTGLELQSDSVSTFVRGDEQRICDYLCGLIATVGRTGRHASASVLLSRGCPGEVCRVIDELPLVSPPVLALTGIPVIAQWALYPLSDGATAERSADHMRDITAVIDDARARRTFLRGDHFVTTLSGDLAQVIATVAAGWVDVGRHVQHVTTHATISINSPTADRP